MEQNINTPLPISQPPEPPVKKKMTSKKIIIIILLILGGVILLPAILLFGGITWLMTGYSATPNINTQAEIRTIENRLYERYGKKFTARDITAKGRSYLGDNRSISAKAQPEDEPSIVVNVSKNLDRDFVYTDNYLQLMWSRQEKQASTPELERIFSYTPQFFSQITIDTQFNTGYREGRVMPISEAVEKHNDKVSYGIKIVANEGGAIGDHSEKAFQVIQYMRSRFTNSRSLEYEFTADGAKYTCNLYNFTYKFMDSAKQLEGCWTKKPLTTPTPETKYKIPNKVTSIDDQNLPIIIKLHKDEVAEKAASGSERYVIRRNDGLVINMTIHRTGFGSRINDDKRQFNYSWVDQNLPIADSTNINHIHPSLGNIPVSIGDLFYRSDTAAHRRTVNYVLFYKTFLVHLSADTVSPDVDLRDKEFSLNSFAISIEAVDGFKET